MSSRILIVEDNPLNMKLMAMTLVSKGYNLLKATDGEEALALAEKERPDLIVMDMQLPKLNGFETTKKLRLMPAFSKTPIIGITAYAMNGDRERVLEAGCDIYLSKPIDTRALPEIIDRMIAEKQAGNPGRNGD